MFQRHDTNKYYAFLLIHRIKLEKEINDPLAVRVYRLKALNIKSCDGYTNSIMSDASNFLEYNTEFAIKIRVEKKKDEYKKQILKIKLKNRSKKGNETIFKWNIDATQYIDGNPYNIHESETFQKELGKAKLFFRLVSIPQSNYPDGKPKLFYSFLTDVIPPDKFNEITEALSTVANNLNKAPPTDDTSAFEDPSIATPVITLDIPLPEHMNSKKHIEHLASFLKPVGTKPKSKPDSEAELPEKPKDDDTEKPKDDTEKQKDDKTKEKSGKTKSKGKKKAIKFTEEINNFLQPERKKLSSDSSSNNLLPTKRSTSYGQFLTRNGCNDFQMIYDQHQEGIMSLAISQCYSAFLETVVNCLIAPPENMKDFSEQLMAPLITYRILQYPLLTSEMLNDLLSPILGGIQISINRKHELVDWFSILSTILNFGLKLSNVGALYTSAHLPFLKLLEPPLTDVIIVLIQNFVPVFVFEGDGFGFAEENSISSIQQRARTYLECAKAFEVPEQIAQVIIVGACNYVDKLIFNLILANDGEFNDANFTNLLKNIRNLQKTLNCLPRNFQAAFANLLKLITVAKTLFCDFDNNETKAAILRQKGPLLRAVFERCSPKISLPDGLTPDDLGDKIAASKLKIDMTDQSSDFKFSFEWFYNQNNLNNPSLFGI